MKSTSGERGSRGSNGGWDSGSPIVIDVDVSNQFPEVFNEACCPV